MIGIYKTTTRSREMSRTSGFQRGRHDKILCGKVFANCLNLDWTGDLIGPDFYYDDVHVKSNANTVMNQQLLDYLQWRDDENHKFRGGVSRIDRIDPSRLNDTIFIRSG